MADAEQVFARYRGHEEDPGAQDRLWQELSRSVLADPGVPFEEHWSLYRTVYADRPEETGPPHAWIPDEATVSAANVTRLRRALDLPDYTALHRWSVHHRAGFWQRAIERLGVPFVEAPAEILDASRGTEHPIWLPGARFNAAAICKWEQGEKTAIIAGREGSDVVRRWSYRELKALADRVSHGLGSMGLRAGSSVALYMPMTPECVAAYLGIVQAGLAVVSIPDSFAPSEVATRLRLGQARAIITVDAFQRGGKAVPLYAKAAEAAGRHVRCIVIGDAQGGLRDGDLGWEEFLGPAEPFQAHPVTADHVSNVLFSSGTTGEPKAIPWTHATPIKAAVDGHFHQDIHPDDVVAWPTNIGWMMGPWLIYGALANGATMALYEGVPTGDAFLEFLRHAKVSVLGVVPAIVRAWMAAGVPPHSLPDVRVFSSTGEASNAHDYLYLMSLAGYRAPVIEYCGGTEIGGGHITGTVVQPASPATFTTAALGIDFVILDEAGKEAAPGDMGEIYLVPPSLGLSQALLNRDHHEEYYAGCPAGPMGEVLRRHGDEIHVLYGGYWTAGGRADDTMNLGGIKVSSVELEAAMNTAPGVLETAAVAVPPPGGGADRLVVFAVVDGKAPAGLQADLQARIKEHLNPLFRVHDVVVVDSLPRTASNKVMRRELRAQYAR